MPWLTVFEAKGAARSRRHALAGVRFAALSSPLRRHACWGDLPNESSEAAQACPGGGSVCGSLFTPTQACLDGRSGHPVPVAPVQARLRDHPCTYRHSAPSQACLLGRLAEWGLGITAQARPGSLFSGLRRCPIEQACPGRRSVCSSLFAPAQACLGAALGRPRGVALHELRSGSSSRGGWWRGA